MTDNAKELLALADRLDKYAQRGANYDANCAMRKAAIALRLSARQQASVEEIDQLLMGTCSVNMTYGACQRQAERSRVALLAKYDIFEKVEG
jgi:hypothetical protein